MNGMRILTVIVVLALSGCSSKQAGPTPQPTSARETAKPTVTPTHPATATPVPGTAAPETETPATIEKQILAMAAEAVAAIKDQDLGRLKAMIDPEQGVRFSPYTHVDIKNDQVFKPDQLAQAMDDKTVYTWGIYDGSGEPITLTFHDYYRKFIYDHDFAKAEKTSYDSFIGKGNMVNNIREAYSGSHFVEYHFSGFDQKLQGQDWASLKLVFTEKGGKWQLTGIVHDQWTI